MSKQKLPEIFTKFFNSMSGCHEFCNHKQNAEALHGTGTMDLIDLQDYIRLEEENKKLREGLEFYADKEMWGKTNQNHFNRVHYNDCNILKSHKYQDVYYTNSMVGGARARKILSGVDGE